MKYLTILTVLLTALILKSCSFNDSEMVYEEKLVVFASISANLPIIDTVIVSKTADIGLIRSLAVELGEFNITVNGLCPGIIKTDFARALWENPKILKNIENYAPLKRIGNTDEVAGAAILLASVELDEILSLSDRIIVMFDGKIVGEKENKNVTDRELGLLMAGVA